MDRKTIMFLTAIACVIKASYELGKRNGVYQLFKSNFIKEEFNRNC